MTNTELRKQGLNTQWMGQSKKQGKGVQLIRNLKHDKERNAAFTSSHMISLVKN